MDKEQPSKFQVGDLVEENISRHPRNIGVVVRLEHLRVNFVKCWRPVVDFGDGRVWSCFPDTLKIIQLSS